jgi:outer membrane protein OmpA-like peptidoglycan-associated protein
MHAFAPKQKPDQKTGSSLYLKPVRAISDQGRKIGSPIYSQWANGNQAGQQLQQAKVGGVEGDSDTDTTAPFAHDSGRILMGGRAPEMVQTKLTVNDPRDSYEQEADRVADQVMRMPESPLQDDCPLGGGCSERQAGKSGHETRPLQRNSIQSGDAGVTVATPVVHDVLSSSGRPLDPTVSRFMEARFGHDFSQVRVHADSAAAESAEALNARAFTHGHHIVFGRSDYSPGTIEGRRLIAHELAHVVQQANIGWKSRGQRAEHKPSAQIMRKERDQAPTIDPKATAKSWFYADDPMGHVASIYFETSSAELDPDDKNVLEQVRNLPDTTKVMVEGWSDRAGDPAFNLDLSERRAQAVASWFAPDYQGGDGEVTVESHGRGEQGPEPTGQNGAELSHYRRVDVIVAPPKKEIDRYKPPEKSDGDGCPCGVCKPPPKTGKLKPQVIRALEAIKKTLDALTTGEATDATQAALQRYFPHPRYRDPEFLAIIKGEIRHIRQNIAKIDYLQIKEQKTLEENCRADEGGIPNWGKELCDVIFHERSEGPDAVALVYPANQPSCTVLLPDWFVSPDPASILIHEAAHMLLGHRGHPTEIPHRDPYAIQGFVAALGGLAAPESDQRYPEATP